MFLRLLFLLLPFILYGGQDFLFSEEDPTLCHNVNVITGHLNLSITDDVVTGPVPLKLSRFYTSLGALERTKDSLDKYRHSLKGKWTLQGGWHFFPEIHLAIHLTDSKKDTTASVIEPSGTSFHYVYSHKTNDHIFFLQPEDNSSNYTVTPLKKNKHRFIEINTLAKRATLFLPTGGKRIYEKRSSSYFYHLIQEVLPSGLEVLYYYTKKDKLKLVTLTPPNNSKMFSWIKIDVLEKKPPHPIYIETSDGSRFHYFIKKYKERFYLKRIDSDKRPSENFIYSNARSGIGPRIETIELEGKKQFTVHYFLPENKEQEIKWKKKPHKRPVHADKVHFIEDASGIVATYFYENNVTDVRDQKGILTRYRHHDNRLDKVEYFDERDQLYSFQHFTWKNDLLSSRSLHNATGKALFCKTFRYDDIANIQEEILYGNLSGNIQECFDKGFLGELSQAETFRKSYEYLEGFPIPTLEIEDEGPTYRYQYLPGTNLLTAKLTCDGSSIIQREFFLYDNYHLLIAEIIDDGVSEYPDDLSFVSERRIKRYENNTQNGLPSRVSEYYLDNGDEILLKRIAFVYTKNKITEELVFDETDTYRYSLKFSYDNHGNMISKTDPFGQTSTYKYNLSDQLKEEQEIGSPLKLLSYDGCERLESIQIGEKQAIVTYDGKGRAVLKKDFKDHETKYHYDPFSRCSKTLLPQIKDENGILYIPILEHGYDIQGHIISEKDPRGALTRTFYTTFGKPYKIIAPDGTETRHIYNKNSTLARTILPCQGEIHYSYDIFQRLKEKKIYAPSGELLREEFWSYNTFHLISYTDVKGLTTLYIYDKAGRKIREEAEDRVRTFIYDALGFLERTFDGCTTHVQIHDIAGRVIEEWTEDISCRLENKMCFTYHENRKASARRITSQKEALDLFDYDEEGRLRLHTDPDGNETQFIYTDNTKTTIDSLKHVCIETYDATARLVLIQQQDNLGRIISQEEILYDRSNNKAKVISTVYNGIFPVKTLTTFWEYNLVGQIIRQVDSGGKPTTFDYFPLENKITKTLPSGIILTSRYDSLGRLIELFSSNASVHYVYSYFPKKTHIADHVHHRALERTYNFFGELIGESTGASWQYDNQGRCVEFTLPDCSSILYTYDGMHMSSVSRYDASFDCLYKHIYTDFDENGHVAKEEMIHNLGTVITEHDLFERPSKQTSSYLTQTVDYNKVHLVEKTETSLFGGKTYTYDLLKQLKTENDRSYDFDSLGNSTHYIFSDALELKSTPNEILEYDLDGNPIKRMTSSGIILYKYDALARLIEIRTEDKTVQYTYDPLSRLYSKEATAASPILYLYDQDKEIGAFQKGVLQELKVLGLGIKGEIGAAIALELSQEVFAPLHDFSGNIIALVSLNQEIVESYDLTAFGEEKNQALSRNPWRFSSKRTEEGLIYFGHRFYDPTLGRWLTPDPSGFTEGINLYIYALNSPLNRLDLFGLFSEPLFSDFRLEIPIVDVTALSRWEFCRVYEGFYRNAKSNFVVACGYWHRLKFTPEELDRGSFNLFDHLGDLMPEGEGHIALVFPKHGIGNTIKDFISMSQMVYDTISRDTLTVGFYSPCKWIGSELWRVCREQLGRVTPRIQLASAFIEATTEFISTKHQGNYMLAVPHSEGGLVLKRGIELIPEEKQKIVKGTYLSIGLGGASPLSNQLAKKAIDFYSNQDYITGSFAKPYLEDLNYDIRIIPAVSKWHEKTLFFADHAVTGGTYRGAFANGSKEMKKEGYKFYNGQNR